jgi:predicted MPP superfamily phosphohydrolase
MVILLVYAFIEPYRVTVPVTVIESPDIPEVFDGMKIVFISDIHRGPFMSEKRVDRIVRRINRLEPDLILLGGDYVHRSGSAVYSVFRSLSALRARQGVYAVLGNHDIWEGKVRALDCMEKAGIRSLDNQGLWLYRGDCRIRLGGVADLEWDSPRPESTTGPVTVKDFVLLVSHNPDIFETLDKSVVDLVLSGHTHGGQVSLFGLWAPLLPTRTGQKYRTGLKWQGGSRILISNGVGTITPPVRFCTPPQINVILLKHEEIQ